MSGLECSEISISSIDLGDRIDAEYFTHAYLHIETLLAKRNTTPLRELGHLVASAFYPAATQLYAQGEVPFVRCVDCISFPAITHVQNDSFERLPEIFISKNKGINILKQNNIVITKVGTPCFSSIVKDYNKVALSRTVLGLIDIQKIIPEFLLVFLRSKYGFLQLYRVRELTIQYQLTLDRVGKVKIYLPSNEFQTIVKTTFEKYLSLMKTAETYYHEAEKLLLSTLDLKSFNPSTLHTSIKPYSQFVNSGRLDAEYYQPKYDDLFTAISRMRHNPNVLKVSTLSSIVSIKKSIEPGSDEYGTEGIPFLRVSDISKFEITPPSIFLDRKRFDIDKLKPKQDTILLSKDGSVGIAYKANEDMDIITSGALLHLTISDKDVNPDYLTLLLNSFLVGMQAERDAGGSILKHWRVDEIKNVMVPILQESIQQEIAKTVRTSFALREQSKALLKAATRAVEIAIEQDEATGIKYLEEHS